MHEVYRDRDSSKVGLFNELLQEEGIATFLGNWNGSNITEIPIPEFFPTIYVLNKADITRARQIIDEYIHADTTGLDAWTCPACGESVDAGLGECWSCQTPHPDSEIRQGAEPSGEESL